MKLLNLLKMLEKDELKDFEKFLQSPFFKASEQYLKFYQYLLRHHPAFDMDGKAMEGAYHRCFGEAATSSSKLYNLLSGLARQVESFLSVRALLSPQRAGWKDLLLLQSLRQRDTGTYFKARVQATLEELSALPTKRSEDFLLLQLLHQELYFHPGTVKHREHPPSLKLALDHLDLYFCISKLRYAAEMKARERILGTPYELPMLPSVMEKTASPALIESQPLAAVYRQLVKLYLDGPGEAAFSEMKQLFVVNHGRLPKEDQRYLLRHLINYGADLNAQGSNVFKDLFLLYQFAIANDMLLEDNAITGITFLNIVTIATACGEYGWAGRFILDFAPYLEQSQRLATVNFAKAHLLYNQGNLDEAQLCLTPEIFTMPPFDITARGLMLKILLDRYLYDGRDFEYLKSFMQAFEKYVLSKKLGQGKKEAQLNFVKFVRRLANIKFEKVTITPAQKLALYEKLEQRKPIVSKSWLSKKIEEM